ncbi:hypothetical protein [Hymenobacter terricola]|uniref:hypothetical protein n=1 Tax=Hymenobacter terricola TaxID=2819236 RepID=UPI001B30038C|nr:hypothetical protein [Hymenobacter terricola]
MKYQKRVFELHEPIGFGQYSKLTIQQIYCGAAVLPVVWCREILRRIFSKHDSPFMSTGKKYCSHLSVSFLGNQMILKIKAGHEYIAAMARIDLTNFDYHTEINNFLAEYYFGLPQNDPQGSIVMYSEQYFEDISRAGIVDYNEVVGKEYYLEEDRYSLHFGKPSYIHWLIKNVEFFSLRPSDLIALAKLDVNSFLGFQVNKITESILPIRALITKRKEFTPDSLVSLNEKKWRLFEAITYTLNSEESYNENDETESKYNYSDGYGGYVNDKLIDDAFDGEPEAYWNID